MLRRQTRQHRELIRQTAEITDEELLEWIDGQMKQTRLYTDTGLTLKTMAQALGLTQKRLSSLFKNNPTYKNLSEYINEKRFLEACRLLREEPNWTIEAVGTAAVAFLLPAFLVGNFDYPFLHTPTCFLLYHHLDFFVDILKGLALHVRCDIYIVIMRQFQTYINGTRVERHDVLWITPVMSLTLFDIAWLDMVAC